MNLDFALRLADAITRACDVAVQSGRTEINLNDLDLLAEMDDAARQDLDDAIKRAEGGA